MRIPELMRPEGTSFPEYRAWVASRAPWLLVALPCLFGLVMFTGELSVVQNDSDKYVHFQMVRWTLAQIHEGHTLPLDGWYPYLNFGFPQFHHYQSLPHLITAYLSLIFGPDVTERWIDYLLLAFFPISVFIGTRLLGWGRWVAGAAAFAAPLITSIAPLGVEENSFLWKGAGLWSQEWGMLLLPIAWGCAWRAVAGAGSRWTHFLGSLTIALTIALHFIAGYLALLSVVVFVLISRRDFGRRTVRALAVAGGALLVSAWVIVPLLSDAWVSNVNEFKANTPFDDSYGAGKILGWLVTGQIFDRGRAFPIVTVLAAVGLCVCAARYRRDLRARALLGLLTVSLLLFFGRPTLGPLLKLVPGNIDLELPRFQMGVHLSGMMLAGVGLVAIVRVGPGWISRRVAHRLPTHSVTALLVVLLLTASVPAWIDRTKNASSNTQLVSAQMQAEGSTDGRDLDVLIKDVEQRGDGRIFAGDRYDGWGTRYNIGRVAVYLYLTSCCGLDAVGNGGATLSLMSDIEADFNEGSLGEYQLYNVRYLIMPAELHPQVPARLMASSGRHRLWEADLGSVGGYMQVVDTQGVVSADRTDMASQMRKFFNSQQVRSGILSPVAFDGRAAAPPTLDTPAQGSPGASEDTVLDPLNGTFEGDVSLNRRAAVMLKATYDPRWQATIDGANASPYMITPGFVAVTAPPGYHVVRFQYTSYPDYAWLLLLGGATLLMLVVGPRLWARRRA